MSTVPTSPYTDWQTYKNIPAARLALMLASHKDCTPEERNYILQQVDGWQRLRGKVPSWAICEGLIYPPRLALEQCSSETTARYKALLVRRILQGVTGERHLVDLTGGLGIDFSFLAPLFTHAAYVERQAALCETARHNFPLLHLGAKVAVHHAEAATFLSAMHTDAAHLIYIDPARRDTVGGKRWVSVRECLPNIVELLPTLREKARHILVKLSPMLDITAAVRELGGNETVEEIHCVGAGGECKELLFLLRGNSTRETASVHPIIFICEESRALMHFTAEEERTAQPVYASKPQRFLYIPSPTTMKAAPFSLLCERFSVEKLSADAHLYVSDQEIANFPGKCYEIETTFTFSKTDLARLRTLCGSQAELSVRGFPRSVEAVKQQIGIKRVSSDFHIYATTLQKGEHVLLVTRKKKITPSL